MLSVAQHLAIKMAKLFSTNQFRREFGMLAA
jgi:hypothetical protein